jgi:hypothetical protein
MTIKALYPTFRPILNLDFAKTKALDPRVTFTRASTGTFVGSNGLIQTAASGTARFDHNPATGESLGLLVEEARTNAALYSDLSSNNVISNATQGLNAATSPDGLFTASLITATSISNNFYQATSVTSGSAYSYSIFVKAGTASYVEFSIFGQIGFTNTRLTFGTGQISGEQSANLSVTAYPGGWFRVTWGFVSNATSIRGLNLRTADGTSYYAWGRQHEAGSFPTSYIPTSGATVTRAADVATVSNTGSSIFPTSAFTTVNSPFGTAGGGSTVKLLGPTVKRTAVYAGDLTQAQINALAGVNDGFWRWRVLGSTFALPNFTTNGSVTVDWGDGVVETLTTAAHTFTNGGGYHDIGFRLNSGTFFRPIINSNATYKDRVIATGPAPASMKFNAERAFFACSNLRGLDATVDFAGGTSLVNAFYNCSNLVDFPLANTSAVTDFNSTWRGCSSLTRFPLINTSAGTDFGAAWHTCSGLTSFPLINTSNGTNFVSTWINCSSLTSFPLINTAAATNLGNAWLGCSSLTSFPLINTSAGTNFSSAWLGCSSLTSFPLINTAAATNLAFAWRDCSSLTSFPLLNTAAGTSFSNAWRSCSSLTSFPANFFDSWTGTPVANCFLNAWDGCSALTATSVENILNSIDTSGQSAPASGVNITIDYNASSGTPSVATAITNLQSRDWTITLNGVLQ